MKTCCLTLLALLAVTVMASCGGNGAGMPLQPEGIGASGTEVPAQAMEGLPALSELYGASRGVSIAEAGWFDLNLAQTAQIDRSSGVSLEQGGLRFKSGDAPAWQLWAVNGFSDAQKPAGFSAQVSAVQGEYYVGVADFQLGRWSFSGPYSESVELEHDDSLGNPPLSNIVSGNDTHYVALLAGPGSSFLLEGAAIGLTGDGSAPAVNQMYLVAGPDYVQVNWNPSADQDALDFAGYSVERSPLVGDDFQPLHEGLLHGMSYIDGGLQPGDFFRYRLRVHDLTGNTATTSPLSAGPDEMGNGQPVVLVDMPAGPLAAPAVVEIDLSGSFDPDGDGIVSYSVDLGSGIGPVTQDSPLFSYTLQPGCYNVICAASDGSTTGYSIRQLKVYPQWQALPTEVVGKKLGARRFSHMAAGINPADGTLCSLVFDVATDNLVLRREDATGGLQEHILRDELENVFELGRPAPYGVGLVFPIVSVDYRTRFAYWSGESLSLLDVDPLEQVSLSTGDTLIGIDGKLYMISSDSFDIIARDILTGQQILLAADTYSDFLVTANEALDCIDFAYSHINGVTWQRLSLELAVLDTADFPALNLFKGTLAADPQNGDLYMFANFNELRVLHSGESDWTEPDVLDIFPSSYFRPQLFFVEGHILLPVKDNGLGIYLYEIANDELVQVGELYDEILDDMFQFSYSPVPGHIRMYDSYSFFGERVLVRRIDAEAGMVDLDPILNTANYGKQLQAVCAGDYLYIGYYRDSYSYYVASSDTENFSDPQQVGYHGSFRLSSNGEIALLAKAEQLDVEFYRFSNAGRTSVLNATQFSNWTQPIGSVGPRSLMLSDSTDADNLLVGADGFDVPYQTDSLLENIWRGSIVGLADWNGIFLSGGATFEEAEAVSIVDRGTGLNSNLYSPTPLLLRFDHMDGRRFSAGSFRDNLTQQRNVYYAVDGPSGNAQRIMVEDGVPRLEDLILDAPDPRRTVSTVEAFGDTCLSVVADNQGDDVRLEWDGFGHFEKLSVPDTGWSNMHVIVVDSDGRWHLVYHDQAEDVIRIWSTV
ncbi:MAG: hypothetical protein H7A35_02155 [Planctomycetales bacterium]|nr:hypothetical protein [bacterium]UNM08862.1 MAG: hypothetical protein H7A35_02155 [Planctomycetales bacterium]